MGQKSIPRKQGLYDPRFEHDACGIGFVANIKGVMSNSILRQGLTILLNLDHRGARGAEPNTGDGAGILIQTPHKFFHEACSELGFALPEPGDYGVGMVFLPPDPIERQECERVFETIIKEEGQTLLGWRTVPTDDSSLGETAKARKPFIRQVFIKCENFSGNGLDFERKLYIIRKRAEKTIRRRDLQGANYFYIPSLSGKTIVYKGMLTPEQVSGFYPELDDPAMETALALVHSRFSTNTFPSWERAHPNRFLIHNGEINTLRGNINWMYARESAFKSGVFGERIKDILPVIDADGSDSAMLDNCLEALYLSGWSLPHAMMMMIPEPYTKNSEIDDELRAFYEYHSCLMEPWDGPAAVAFTDGTRVGAVLDRNGLRPSRYYVTKNDLVIMASEVGVVDLPAEDVLYKGRLQAGRMLLVDTKEGRIISDQELKEKLAKEHPYQEWVNKYLLTMNDLSDIDGGETEGQVMPLVQKQKAFGYTYEELRKLLLPMATDGVEPIGAMGTDTPLAVLSERPQLLYDYFKQLFAQVTNPPIDAIREDIVTSTEIFIGAEGNLLEPEPENCRQLKLEHPILSDQELAKLRKINSAHARGRGFKAVTLSILYNIEEEGNGLKAAMERLYQEAEKSIAEGANIIILSDRGINEEKAAIPCLLAVSGLHHYLIREKLRTRVSLVIESGEPREVHHFALLIGYGASAVNPYLAFESIRDMVETGLLPEIEKDKAVKNYIKALVKGVIKVLSKMGISTVQSYQGAQIFEAVGISPEVIDKYFTWTPSRVGGVGLDIIACEARMRHESAFNQNGNNTLKSGGVYQWRKNGEYHIYNPETIHKIQEACRKGDYGLYKEYSALISDNNYATFRRLFKFKTDESPIPLQEVEPVESICRRFKTGAMSFGSISKEAHEALAIAMNRIGGKSNTGEGGEDADRFAPDPNGDSRCSAIKQVASGRFGVTVEYLNNAKEIQIKIAQGAKPGEGGQLPGKKVYPWVAKVRHSTPGVGLISPPPHHDIYSIEDLAELIYDLKNANPQARISVKLVSEVGVGTIAAGVAKGGTDVILISSFDGGTGASPRTSIRHAGLPWELGLAETHQTLLLNNLRSRVVLETDGKLMNGPDVVIAALLGAEEYGFATLPLVALGCVMMRVCNLDTCPVGVATQNPELRKRFMGDPQHVVNLMGFIAQEMREIMAGLGFRTVEEMIGRVDRIELGEALSEPDEGESLGRRKLRTLDLAGILYQPEVPAGVGHYCQTQQDHSLKDTLDKRVLLNTCAPTLSKGERMRAILPIKNTDRVVGTILGSEVYRRFGKDGLPEDTIHLHLKGSAGQSFAAFLPPGITMTLEGDANDYMGKGLSGGKIIVYPPENSTFVPEENVIIGNVAFYGATNGEAYIYGMAGERFCVRNSGIKAVVESVGDHGCEYMTGGRVIVLGETGRNFAAGMTGGIAYVYDEQDVFEAKCNKEMVELESLVEKDEIDEVKRMIKRHLEYTGSRRAKAILAGWTEAISKFVKVIPKDYKRMLSVLRQVQESGLGGDEAAMVAFEQNKSDLKRVSGN